MQKRREGKASTHPRTKSGAKSPTTGGGDARADGRVLSEMAHDDENELASVGVADEAGEIGGYFELQRAALEDVDVPERATGVGGMGLLDVRAPLVRHAGRQSDEKARRGVRLARSTPLRCERGDDVVGDDGGGGEVEHGVLAHRPPHQAVAALPRPTGLEGGSESTPTRAGEDLEGVEGEGNEAVRRGWWRRGGGSKEGDEVALERRLAVLEEENPLASLQEAVAC